jgi:hypothetical protein
MGHWKGKTFKEYIREELHNFSEGISRSMKKVIGFVNISGGIYHDITSTVMTTEYDNGKWNSRSTMVQNDRAVG